MAGCSLVSKVAEDDEWSEMLSGDDEQGLQAAEHSCEEATYES